MPGPERMRRRRGPRVRRRGVSWVVALRGWSATVSLYFPPRGSEDRLCYPRLPACPLPPPGFLMPARFGRIVVAVALIAVPAVGGPPREVWWSLRPLTAPPAPAVTDGGRNPIDAFIRAKLTDK